MHVKGRKTCEEEPCIWGGARHVWRDDAYAKEPGMWVRALRVRKSHVCVGVWVCVCVCVCVCYPFPGRNHLCVSEKRVSEALGHWNPARSLPSLSHKIAQMQVKVRVKFPPSILLTYVQIRTELGTLPFLCFRVIDALTRHKRV